MLSRCSTGKFLLAITGTLDPVSRTSYATQVAKSEQ